ncbi:TMEM175 family protein [Flavobacterium sp. N3904]|uniref:TMEM175 family protein n=1 Tax=Flavobacterium sp. N3904 TaxID=2986835 RepID=UPI0022257F24|nr:TMEM175 family protein [Flavobacterium sp. N3904]
MVRKFLNSSLQQREFRYRGKEIFRIEGLSDAVFAFSVSLLVASLEVPQTFYELKEITKGAIPFFLTVALVFLFWYRQYIFFRRYGLNDLITIILNLAYLAIVIFYLYPLKFLFSLLISSWFGVDLFAKAKHEGLVILSNNDFPQLIILFSLGYFMIWLIIFLLHQHVIQLADQFGFSKFELLFTKKEVKGALLNSFIGLFALTFAYFDFELYAGLCYFLIPIVLIVNHYIFKKKVKKIVKA